MSEPRSARSSVIAEELKPENTQDSSSEESFVFHREVTSEQDYNSIADLDQNRTFVADDNEIQPLNRQLTFDKDREDVDDCESDIELVQCEDVDMDADSTCVEDHINERVSASLDSEKTEYLMSEHEIADWDRRMDELVERFQKQQEEYEVWENGLNRRRLLAHERLKKLRACHTRRVELYTAVTGYLGDMNSILESKNI